MIPVFVLAALAGAAGPVEHRVRVDHPRGAADVSYRGVVHVAHRQVGSVAPAGRPSTLRCRWSAEMVVDREMRIPAGHVVQRRIDAGPAVQGTRSGWCDASRTAIARELAAAEDRLHAHLLRVAAEDRPALLAELERLPGAPAAG